MRKDGICVMVFGGERGGHWGKGMGRCPVKKNFEVRRWAGGRAGVDGRLLASAQKLGGRTVKVAVGCAITCNCFLVLEVDPVS